MTIGWSAESAVTPGRLRDFSGGCIVPEKGSKRENYYNYFTRSRSGETCPDGRNGGVAHNDHKLYHSGL